MLLSSETTEYPTSLELYIDSDVVDYLAKISQVRWLTPGVMAFILLSATTDVKTEGCECDACSSHTQHLAGDLHDCSDPNRYEPLVRR